MDYSTPGLPIYHQFLEFTQTHELMSIELVMPPTSSSAVPFSSHLQSFPATGSSLGVSSSHQVPKYWSFSFSIIPSNEYSGQISFRMDWLDLVAVQGILKNLPNTTVQKHQFFSTRLSSKSTLTFIHDQRKNHSLH